MTRPDLAADPVTHATATPAPAPKLAVGVLLRALDIPVWQHAALESIAGSSHSELALAIVVPGGAEGTQVRSAAQSILARIVARLDARMVCEVDALELKDARALLERVSVLQRAPAVIAEALAGRGLDVLVDLGGVAPPREIAALVRHGVWSVTQPYSVSADAAEASFWPVYHGWAVGEAVLEETRADGSRVALATTTPATNPFSLKLNASALCWRIAALVPQTLRRLHEEGAQRLPQSTDRAPSAMRSDAPLEAPGTAALARYVARNVTRRARASAARRFMLDQWILLYRRGDALSTAPAEFTKLVPPKDRFWADPHLVRRHGRYYAFIEECPFDTGKGHIAVLSLGDDGTWSAPVKVLEREYHLSYPFVFEHDGELYMVPESEANRTIDLYRCTDFPQHWEHVRTLLTDIAATDSTLIEHDGRWWLFANVVDNPGASFSDELYLFHSDALTGPWKPHRRNPIVSDARRARPAGAIMRREGRLLRPAQDCSVRYGYGVRLHEIERLDEAEYREREIERIEPTWDGRIVAVHTLSHVPGLTMLDALQPRLRF
ncbi:MAG TPA: family 43 glycosylhydrolase [Burkholderiales bacterium]|nr:family 43 glycosylhydrolase [Burkholderiales bacterium]